MRNPSARPELLAPAGDWESLRAAVANGADAVYFGLQQFNARFRAVNFETAELPEILDYLHLRGVRGYVTLNTLVFSEEFPQLLDHLNALAAADVDAVIVQDVGLALLLQRLFPHLTVHASTQTTQTDALGINLLATLGIERVILARELSLDDIKQIRASTDVPVEVFVHGALCVAYSGQCLTSEALGGRSANRGQCAQACRMPYELYVDGEHRELGDRAYLLSPQDLAAYDLVRDLAELGVVSLKIEGRLKGGPYVAAATRTYRTAIDAALRGEEFRLDERSLHDLEQTFSRGLFHGFLGGVNHQATTPARFPKHRGVRLGTVVGSTSTGVLVELVPSSLPQDERIKPGDGVLFDESRPEEKEPGGRVVAVLPSILGKHQRNSALAAEIVELRFRREDLRPASIKSGSPVWKTDDPAVRKRLQKTYAVDKPVQRLPVDFVLTGQAGGPLHLTATTQEQTASASWQGPLEAAIKSSTSVATIVEHLGRLGETPFELNRVSVDSEPGLLIPLSILNRLRREAIAELTQKQSDRFRPVTTSALASLRQEVVAKAKRSANDGNSTPAKQPNLAVLVRTLDQLRTVAEWSFREGTRPTLVYCDFEDVRRYRDAIAVARSNGIPIGLATLRIIKPGEDRWLRLVADCEPDLVLVRNLSGLGYFRQQFPHLALVGDFSLNVTNDLSAAWFRGLGLARMVPGFDLNWDQLVALVRQSEPAWFEAVVHYHMPMFHMEHCVFAAFLSQGKDWRDCGRPCDHHELDVRDVASGARFPVIPDAGCRNTVFNQVPQSAAEYLRRMLKLGLRHFRIELLREPVPRIGPLVALYQSVLAGQTEGSRAWRQVRALNQLGVTRGTLQLL